MIIKSFFLGLLLFLVDFLIYGLYILQSPQKKELTKKIKFTLPINLFMQIIFAMIFIFSFRFLAVLKALETTLGGGLYFAYVLFVPMLYMLFSNWLWVETKKDNLYLNIFIWGLKLFICGLAAPFI